MSDSLHLSLVELPRQLGSTLTRELTWVVPEDCGTSSMRVEPGTELPIDVTLTSVDDGVLVQLSTDIELLGECVRCLDPVRREHAIDTAEVFFEPEAAARFAAEAGEDEEADDLLVIDRRNSIDIEPLLRDSIITLVDERPLCSEDCEGLCQDCGERWADLPEDHAHEVIDPRLAGLAALLDSGLLRDGDSSDQTEGEAR
ncbi:DUF177 domain-containing protein [Schaalia sp. Marseille-Q2122]|uniref:YceD family protein n=1 Tax=Schaalia sp. Marseille-Q2122 TaxID=2736604 RepID=UPI00158D7A25|nr:DUF177 domain-containing protein [Schaalia sp. Marseille-Q2122]